MKTIGVAIIGCGGIRCKTICPALRLRGYEAVALCDTIPPCQKASREPGITDVDHYEEIVRRDDVQAVIIATPNFAHGPIALAEIRRENMCFAKNPWP